MGNFIHLFIIAILAFVLGFFCALDSHLYTDVKPIHDTIPKYVVVCDSSQIKPQTFLNKLP